LEKGVAKAASEQLEQQVKLVGEAWEKSVYYDNAERWTHLFWDEGTAFREMFSRLDLTYVIELACGHGRHSEKVADEAGHIVMVDIFEDNLAYCRKRLAGRKNIEFLRGSGTAYPVTDSVATSVFCYDAMVHFSPDMVAAYMHDTARVLKLGGKALFHHSNYPAPLDRHYGENPHARNHMTAALFAEHAKSAGLTVDEQRIFRWGQHNDLDALTLVSKV
jgi:ubiquinone/menaquinone biosynthesis C-methylase UbiE